MFVADLHGVPELEEGEAPLFLLLEVRRDELGPRALVLLVVEVGPAALPVVGAVQDAALVRQVIAEGVGFQVDRGDGRAIGVPDGEESQRHRASCLSCPMPFYTFLFQRLEPKQTDETALFFFVPEKEAMLLYLPKAFPKEEGEETLSVPTVVLDAHRRAVFGRIAERLHVDPALRARILANGAMPRRFDEAYGLPAGHVYELDAHADFPGLLDALKADGFWASGCLFDAPVSKNRTQALRMRLCREQVQTLHALVELSFRVTDVY